MGKLSFVGRAKRNVNVSDVSLTTKMETSLTPAERVVVNYILNNMDQFEPDKWATQVAEHFGMSEFAVKRAWAKHIEEDEASREWLPPAA